jgi:hypothetical protein
MRSPGWAWMPAFSHAAATFAPSIELAQETPLRQLEIQHAGQVGIAAQYCCTQSMAFKPGVTTGQDERSCRCNVGDGLAQRGGIQCGDVR